MNFSKRTFFRKLILVMICLVPLAAIAQEAKQGTDKGQSPASTRAQRKKLRKKWKEDRRIERDEKKAIKEHHKRIQSKETLKRMKKERKKGDKLRANKREPWIVRKFKYRKQK